jgi:putative transposase
MPHWPHAPVHYLKENGTYMVTAGTYNKEHFFKSPDRLDLLQENLLAIASEFKWKLQAWSIFSNHYHFIAICENDPMTLKPMLTKLHANTSRKINELDNLSGRKVWYQYWDSFITYQKSYLARLNYVHRNPVKHGLVALAEHYPWCSASWFEMNASLAFQKVVASFKIDKLQIVDDF